MENKTKMKIEKIEKIIGEIEVLTIQSFNEKYPSWISNSLTTVELTLKKTLKEIQELEILKKRISKLNVINNKGVN
jgi:hypothetical protein